MQEIGIKLFRWSHNRLLNLSPFFSLASFPRLRSLKLNLSVSSSIVRAISTFLNGHTTIEVLHLAVYCGNNEIEWAHNVVPLLKEFSGAPAEALRLLAAPCEAPRPLENIQSVEINDFFWREVLPKIDAFRLRKLEVDFFIDIDNVLRLHREFPCLVYLFVDGRIYDWSNTSHTCRHVTKVRESHVLCPYAALTT